MAVVPILHREGHRKRGGGEEGGNVWGCTIPYRVEGVKGTFGGDFDMIKRTVVVERR